MSEQELFGMDPDEIPEDMLDFFADYDRMEQLRKDYQDLPWGPQRTELNREYVALADKLEEPFDQLAGRYQLAYAYILGDDPAKALPVCAEFMALQQEHPDELDGGSVAMIAMLASSVARDLPQIPKAQCAALLEEFHQAVLACHSGERLWEYHACEYALMTGDREAAEAHLKRFQELPRDDLSDCEACEVSGAAEILLRLGRREEAMAALAPVLEQRITCAQQPWEALSTLIHDALGRGDVRAARQFGKELLRRPIENQNDLPYAGALLRLESADSGGGWADAALLERCLSWARQLWDQKRRFWFFLGAGAFCPPLGEMPTGVRLSLPTDFPIPGADHTYSCQALEAWLRAEGEKIARAFDRRNGCVYYQEILRRA